MDRSVTDNTGQARFEIREDGELAGFAQYRRQGNQIVFTHTETGSRFRGRGLAGRLVRAALDQAGGEGLAVVPVCPYVREWIAANPGYAGLVPQSRRREFGL